MSDPLDLDQQRKIAEFRRRTNRQRGWFTLASMICLGFIPVAYLWSIRPALAAQPGVIVFDVLVVVVALLPVLVLIYLFATGRLRLILEPGQQAMLAIPYDPHGISPVRPNAGPSQGQMILSYVLLYAGAMTIGLLIYAVEQKIEALRPDIPIAIVRAIASVLMLISVIGLSFLQAWVARRAGTTVREFWANRLGQLLLLGLFALLYGAASYVGASGGLPGYQAIIRWVLRNPLIVLGVIGGLAIGLSMFVPWLTESALKQGDYDTALNRLDRWSFLIGRPEARLFFRGSILLFAGRSAEAEQLLIESARRDSSQATLAFVMENLGYARIQLGRYEQAQKDFETAIRLNPEGHGAYSGLAEVFLWQGMHERYVLELIEQALANHARSETAQRASAERVAEYWSVKAWALALGGTRSEADEALASAFRLAHRDYIPVLALIHVRAGRVYSLRGDQTRAKENFQKAVELDPEGYAGNSARCAQAMTPWLTNHRACAARSVYL